MSSKNNKPEDKALQSVEELFKTLITTAGVMLALLWGLTQRDIAPQTLLLIRVSSIVLVVSISIALLGMQFIVAQLEKGAKNITKQLKVSISFLLAWLSFIAGCISVIMAIFQI